MSRAQLGWEEGVHCEEAGGQARQRPKIKLWHCLLRNDQQSIKNKLRGSKKIGKKEQRRWKTQRRRTVLDDFPILTELW